MKLKGMRIGWPRQFLPPDLNTEVRDNFQSSLRTLEKLGAHIEEISLPHTDYGIACYYVLAPAEASANLARYDGVRYGRRASSAQELTELLVRSRTEGLGAEVRRRVLLGTFVLSSGYYDAYYLKAQKARTLVCQDFHRAWEKVDVLACPTSPTSAFPLGSKTSDPLQMYLSDVFTVTISLAGLPGLSVPSGFTGEGLPLGLQLVGPAFAESRLLQLGKAFEAETKFYERRPPV